MFSGEYCWIFKITFFEEYLQTAAFRCYFDTISHKAICNLALAQPILLKFLFQNENIKIILKIVNLKYVLKFSYI